MRVVFLETVKGAGQAGEIKEVSDGYARNFLLPRQLAAAATDSAVKRLEDQRKQGSQKAARIGAQAAELAAQLNATTVTLTPKVGAQGRLYGSVTNSHIAQQLQKLTGHAIDHRRVLLENPIRSLGEYEVPVRLTNDISATVKVVVRAPAG